MTVHYSLLLEVWKVFEVFEVFETVKSDYGKISALPTFLSL